jgi:hypothetical protein
MLSNWIGYFLLTVFNTTVCLVLPRVISTNWKQVFSQWFDRSTPAPEPSRDRLTPPDAISSIRS